MSRDWRWPIRAYSIQEVVTRQGVDSTVQGEYAEGEEQEAWEAQGEEPHRGSWRLQAARADNTSPVSSYTCSLWLLAPP